MRQLVVNKYNEVLVVMGNTLQTTTTIGTYQNVKEALDAMSKFFYNTLWQEKPENIEIYGVVTEENGYKHTPDAPIYKTRSDKFWGGKQPGVREIQK